VPRLIGWLKVWTKPTTKSALFGAVGDAMLNKADLRLENALLRQPLIVMEHQVKRSKRTWRDRAWLVLTQFVLGKSEIVQNSLDGFKVH
jgi:hypothetical protein